MPFRGISKKVKQKNNIFVIFKLPLKPEISLCKLLGGNLQFQCAHDVSLFGLPPGLYAKVNM